MELAQVLVQKYDVVVTNPPYMGSSGMGTKLADFVKKNYPDSKSDLFAVFIEACGKMTRKDGFQAMITQQHDKTERLQLHGYDAVVDVPVQL